MEKSAHQKLMETSIEFFFLCITNYISCILLSRFCYLLWKKLQHSGRNPSKAETENLKTITFVVKLIKLLENSEIEINLQYFTIDTSDSNTSEDTVYCIEPISPVTNIFFSDTDENLDSSPDSSDNSNLPPGPPVLEKKSVF